jgi:hypothetical protein
MAIIQYVTVLMILLMRSGESVPSSINQAMARSGTLTCYNCTCTKTPCSCTEYETLLNENTYCVIVQMFFGQSVNIDFEHIDSAATPVYIREFPYVLVEESINYNEGNGRWFTTTNFVIYGCDWNLCNKPDLVPLLPNSFRMRLPEAWLNTSVLGSGLPVRDCHECPDAPQCGTSDFLDAARCPIQECDTTCIVSDSFNDPATDEQCYQSRCVQPNQDQSSRDQHRVEIEGVIYAIQPDVVELWEIDIYCRADDCSRPSIFNELRKELIVQTSNLNLLFNETQDPTNPKRRCYDCFCSNEPKCPCNKTKAKSAKDTYCTIIVENSGQDLFVIYEHIDTDSTRVSIREFPYILVDESILYNERKGEWYTINNLVVYGCNWDYCNDPRLLQAMPNSFQMRLPETWLNSSVLGTGETIRDCHECPDAPQCGSTDFLDVGRCPIQSCNTTCLVSDKFNDPAKDEQCYQSFCAPPDTNEYQIEKHRVELEAILYLNKPSREIELWEVDIYCRADDCSRPDIFKEVSARTNSNEHTH